MVSKVMRTFIPFLFSIGLALGIEPTSKATLDKMVVIIREHISWNNWTAWSTAMRPLWAPNFTYDFVQPLGKEHGLHNWYEGEHLHYNEAFPSFRSYNFLYLGTDDAASLQSYHIVRWVGDFAGVPAPPGKPLIKIKDMDYYTIKDGMIAYNWCMVDLVGILQQGGYEVLPPPPMPNGIDYLPPRAMDGIPAPDDDYATPEDAAKARSVVAAALQEDLVQQSLAASWWVDDLMWCGPAGIGRAEHRADYVEHFLKPLRVAFSDPEMKVDKFVCESNYCGVHFHLYVTHTGPWLGQSATDRRVYLRFGTHFRVVFDTSGSGRVADGWAQVDIVDTFSQMGVDLLARAKVQYPALVEKYRSEASQSKLEALSWEPPSRPASDTQSRVVIPEATQAARYEVLLAWACLASFLAATCLVVLGCQKHAHSTHTIAPREALLAYSAA